MEHFWLPVRASEHAGSLDQLNAILHWLMLVLFVGWGAFFLYTLYRFRASKNPRADYVGVKSHTSTYAEIAVAIIEVVLLVGFSIPLWATRVNEGNFPDPDKSVRVRVVAQQFAWNVHYPGPDGKFGPCRIELNDEESNPIGLDRKDPTAKDDVVVLNQLYLPVHRPAVIEISSKDVIHSFALQQMRIKQDAIPGQRIPVWFVPTKTTAQIQEEMARMVTLPITFPIPHVAMEDYPDLVKKGAMLTPDVLNKLAAAGQKHILVAPASPTEITCAQLCGNSHYRMRGSYTVLPEAEYDQWIKDKSAAAASGGESYE